MTVRVVAYLDESLVGPLEEVARRQRWSRSETVAWLIEKQLRDRFPDLFTEAKPEPPEAENVPRSAPPGNGEEPSISSEPHRPPAAKATKRDAPSEPPDTSSPWERLAKNQSERQG